MIILRAYFFGHCWQDSVKFEGDLQPLNPKVICQKISKPHLEALAVFASPGRVPNTVSYNVGSSDT